MNYRKNFICLYNQYVKKINLNKKLKMKILIMIMILMLIPLLSKSDNNIEQESKSFVFDGLDDLILVPDSEIFRSKSMTLSLDFKINEGRSLKSGSNRTSQFLVFKKNPKDHFNEGITIFYDELAGNITAMMSNLARKQVFAYSAKRSIRTNTWYNIVVSCDTIDLQLYLDGVAQKSNPTGFPLYLDKEPMFFGGRNNVLLEQSKYGGMLNGELRNITLLNQSINEIGKDVYFAKESIPDSLIILEYTNHESSGIVYDKYEKNNGVFVKGKLDRKDNSLIENLLITPNPVKNKSELTFKLVEDSNLKVIVRDITGAELMTLYSGLMNAGDHRLPFKADKLKDGFYICYIEKENEIYTVTFIVNN